MASLALSAPVPGPARPGPGAAPGPVRPARALSPSGHADTFARDHLPPRQEWPDLCFDLPGLRYPQRLNCARELLDGSIGRFGADRPCLTDQYRVTWSYAQVLDRVDRVARFLVQEAGLASGNRVLLRGPNTPWLAVCWLAVLKAGAVVVTTVPLLRPAELRAVAERAQVQLALCDERFDQDWERARTGVPTVLFGPGADGGDLGRRARHLAAGFRAAATAADDVALIAFTSGTSGVPKATMHFHRDVLAIADTFGAHVLRPGPDDVFAGSPPLAFTFGLGGLLVFPLRAGAQAVLLEDGSPRALFAAVPRFRITTLFTAPTAYRAVLEFARRTDLRTLHSCVSAGEPLPEATWRAFREATGVRIIDGIGSTEMLHVFIAAAGDDIRPGATGRVVPGYRAKVVDASGAAVPDGVPGLLAVQGPTGCRYLADPRQRTQVERGWNLTGDTCVRDADGYFWYRARSDDMIVSSGYNIAAPEVEQALLLHPAVALCAVVGVPDPRRGSVVKAFVQPAAGARPGPELAAELQGFVKQQIAPYKYPRVVEFVGALPHSSTGKLQRAALRGGDARGLGESGSPC